MPLNFTLSFCQRTTLFDDFSLSKLLMNSQVTGHWQSCSEARGQEVQLCPFPSFFPVLFTKGQITPQPVTPKSWRSTKDFKILRGVPCPPLWDQAVMLAWTGWVVLKAMGMVGMKLLQMKPLHTRAVPCTRCSCWVAMAASFLHLSSSHRMLNSQSFCTEFGSSSPRYKSFWSHLFSQFSHCSGLELWWRCNYSMKKVKI